LKLGVSPHAGPTDRQTVDLSRRANENELSGGRSSSTNGQGGVAVGLVCGDSGGVRGNLQLGLHGVWVYFTHSTWQKT